MRCCIICMIPPPCTGWRVGWRFWGGDGEVDCDFDFLTQLVPVWFAMITWGCRNYVEFAGPRHLYTNTVLIIKVTHGLHYHLRFVHHAKHSIAADRCLYMQELELRDM